MALPIRNIGADTSARHRFMALDSLRGICACMIVLFHLRSTGTITNAALVRNSWMFVDFFFVLSGFVIACGYLERLRSGYSVGQFLALRLGRIYPLHLAVLLLFVALEVVGAVLGTGGLSAREAFSEPRTPAELAGTLALVQIFCGFPTIVWNGPSWSIAAELWTYLLLALLVRAMPRHVPWVASALALAALTLLALGGPAAWDPATAYAFARCVLGFSCGMLAWILFAAMGRPSIGAAFATLLELVAAASCWALVVSGSVPLLAPIVFTGTVLLFAAEQGLVSRMLTCAPFVLLGTLSYSIYMVHTLVIARSLDLLSLTGKLLHHPLVNARLSSGGTTKTLIFAPDLMAIAVLGVVVLCAAVTYRWIEMPARNLSRSWTLRATMRSRVPAAAESLAGDRDTSPATVAA